MSGRGSGKNNESNESSDVSNSDSESESDMDQSQNSQKLYDLRHTDTEADDSSKDPNYSPSTTPTKGKKGVNLLKIHILILPQHQKIHLDHIMLKQEQKSL